MTATAATIDDAAIAIGPHLADATAVAILVHGRGRCAAEMRDLAMRLDNPAVRFVMPAAPGGTWYPQSFLAPLADNEPALSRSLTRSRLAVSARACPARWAPMTSGALLDSSGSR